MVGRSNGSLGSSNVGSFGIEFVMEDTIPQCANYCKHSLM